jgi:hypothetical protein
MPKMIKHHLRIVPNSRVQKIGDSVSQVVVPFLLSIFIPTESEYIIRLIPFVSIAVVDM